MDFVLWQAEFIEWTVGGSVERGHLNFKHKRLDFYCRVV